MKRLAYLLTLLIAAVLGGACGMQPGGTHSRKSESCSASPNRSIPRTPSPHAHS